MDSFGGDAAALEIGSEFGHEAGWAAQEVVGGPISDQPCQQPAVDPAVAVVAAVLGARPAIGYVYADAFALRGRLAHLSGEGMVAAVARTVHEPNRSFALLPGEGVEHAHHGGHPDPGTRQHHRAVAAADHEVAARAAR